MSISSLQEALKYRRQPKKQTIYGADLGVNNRDLESVIDLRYATKQDGFIIDGLGKLVKTKGYQELLDLSTSSKIFLDKYDNNLYIIAFDKKAGYWNKSNGQVIYFYESFTTSDPFSGASYGEKYYLCNGGDRIGSANGQMDIDYDNLAGGTFTAGNTVKGATNDYTATIVSDSVSAPTGTLTLKTLTGNFEDNEQLIEYDTSGTATGITADANGVLKNGFSIDSSAPYAKVLKVWGKRLLAGNTYNATAAEGDVSEMYASSEDTGNYIDDWTIGSEIGKAFKTLNRRAGELKSIGIVNNQVVQLFDTGKNGFTLQTIDVGTSGLQQNTRFDFDKYDFGGAKNALSTVNGIFYANEFGVFWLAGGLEDKVEEFSITNILGDEIDNYNFDNIDIIDLPLDNKIVISCAKDGTENNTLLVFDTSTRAISTISGFAFNELIRNGNDIYATNDGKIYLLFDGYDADGANIWCEYHTPEITFGDETDVKDLKEISIIGKLSLNSVKVSIDVWDRDGYLLEDNIILIWTADAVAYGYQQGYGKISYGGGSSYYVGSYVNNVGHLKIRLKKFTKIKIKISENSMYPLEINKIIPTDIRVRKSIRKNNLVRQS